MLESKVLFDDKDVKIREQCVTIKTYYFPFGTSKRIPIAQIQKVAIHPLSGFRIWGTGTFQYWFACDKNRLNYNDFIAIDDGSSILPAFTCTNNQMAFSIITKLVENYKKGIIGIETSETLITENDNEKQLENEDEDENKDLDQKEYEQKNENNGKYQNEDKGENKNELSLEL